MPEIRPRPAATWLLTIVALAASITFLVARASRPSDGAAVAFYADAWRADGVQVRLLPGPPSGLQAHDVVTAVDGRPLAAWIDGALDPGFDRSAWSRPSVPYAVVRESVPIDVDVTLAHRDVGGLLVDYWSALLFTVVLQVVAAYVLWRRPAASAATALAVAAVGVTGSTIPWLLGLEIGDIVSSWPFLLYAATAGGLYMLLWPAGAIHLPLAMTSAAAPRRRTLALVYGIPLGAYAVGVVGARIASPSAVAWIGTWAAVQGAVIVPTLLFGIALTVRRYRAAPDGLRAQTRWVAVAGSVSVVGSLVLLFVPQLLTGRPLIPWSAVGLLALPMPLGVAAAILRRRLFDLDVVANRALVYGGVTVAIGAIYVLAVSLIGRLFGLGEGLSSSLLATGLAAVAALPIRDALQRVVNRLMYGDRDDPYRALIRLGRRLEGALDPLEAPNVIVRTIAESLRLPWVAIRIDGLGEADRLFAYGGQTPLAPLAVPLVYGAEVVGDLLVAPRSPGEPLTAADRKLLEDLARQVGSAVHALRLTLDLFASRERLVAAREEERRRIRRDLHDGLGPTLAAIGLRAEVAADLVARDPAGAGRVLEEMRGEVRGAIADIRRLVDDLRPPALDELGLVGALQAQAGHLGPVPSVEVTAPGPLPELPAAIEVAAYRIAVEAMTNSARHSGATICRVRVSESAGAAPGEPRALEVEVTDDGRGLPEHVRPGIGLVSMRERAAEVGGACIVSGLPGGGTRVLARLPFDETAQRQEARGG
jgi:signal transduction histidine kinase